MKGFVQINEVPAEFVSQHASDSSLAGTHVTYEINRKNHLLFTIFDLGLGYLGDSSSR